MKKNSYFISYSIKDSKPMMWAFDVVIQPGTVASYIMGHIMIEEVRRKHSGTERTDIKFHCVSLLNSEEIDN